MSLPRPLSLLVGRERETAEVADALLAGDVRLLTLTGPGGVGKTRLALNVLDALADGAFDRVAFVPLAALRQPELVLPAIAEALGAPNSSGQPVRDWLGAYLRRQRALLALDNFEHLADAAPIVADLLRLSDSLVALVTSRSRLNLSGERVYPVRPLPDEASTRLFALRATAITPAFALTPDLAPTVDAICARLDRLPLAIELAAARIAALPPSILLDRLARPLPLLTGGAKDAPDRQRTMRDVIAWSYDLLTIEGQALFRRLGVFVGGFTLDAAEAVADEGTDVLAVLESLITASLVISAPTVGGVPRYTMLETIREFAAEQLTALGEDAAARTLHARHFATALEAELPNQDGPGMRDAHERIEADLQNSRAALAWTIDQEQATVGIRLAGALWRTWNYNMTFGDRPLQERLAEGRSWLDRTLAMRDGLPLAVLTEALAGAAQLANFAGDAATALAWAEELQARAVAEPDAYAMFWSGLILGLLATRQGDYAAANRMYDQAIDAAPAIRNPESGLAQVLTMKGDTVALAGEEAMAAGLFERALDLARASGNPMAIGMAAESYGGFLRSRGKPGPATRLLAETVAALLDQKQFDAASATLVDIARIAQESGHAASAAALAGAVHPHPIVSFYGLQPLPAGSRSDAERLPPDDGLAAARNGGQGTDWGQALATIEALVEAIDGKDEPAAPRPATNPFGLTPRELEVIALLAEGRSNRAIAEQLYLSERTVANHLASISSKLGLESRTAVVAFAIREGLV